MYSRVSAKVRSKTFHFRFYNCFYFCELTNVYLLAWILSNYWMRLSRIWRILQIREGVIHRGRRPRWITPSENSSYPTKAEFNNCFIIHSKYFLVLKGVSPLRSLFFRSPNITQPCPQVFSVNGSIISRELHFWRHWFNLAKILSKFGEQQLVMVNYACGFNQSETGWMNNN